MENKPVENQETDLLKSISHELLIDNARMKNELDDKESELEGLYSIIRDVASQMDWQEIHELVIEILLDILSPTRFCLIALWRESESMLHVRFKRADDESIVVDRIRLPMSFDETTRWEDTVETNEWSDYFQALDLKDLKYSFIPLAAKERQLGFLMIGKLNHLESFRGEWRFLTAVSHYIAVTIENAMLYQLATTDPLTGLFNRRYFNNRLQREIDRAERRSLSLALLMFDIDRFKEVNDRFGHPAGDLVLIELSKRVKDVFQQDAVLCRYGGEEFTVLIIDVDATEAFARAEILRRAICGTPFSFTSEREVVTKTISVSVGVAVFPAEGVTPKDLIDKSDQYLYDAKENGRNRVVSSTNKP